VTGAEFHGVDVDLLADYLGGALAGTPDESVVATLIADDPAWRSAYESLSGDVALVVAELGRFEPEPMPEDVAARLEAAFAEAGARPQLTLVAGDEAPRVREKRKLRWVTPIAIAAGTVAFVGFGLDYLAGRGGGASDTASSSSGGSLTQERRDTANAPAIGGAEPGYGESQSQRFSSEAPKAASPQPQVLTTGTDYTRATLAAPAPEPLLAPGASSSPDAAGATIADELGRLSPMAGLQQCLNEIAEANGAGPITAESVDYAKFEGKPAIVVRFTAKNGMWAWASGPACGTPAGGADTRAKVPVR